jgi:hypothetical protein
MIKRSLVFLSLLLVTATTFSFENSVSDEFRDRAYKLLRKNAQKIRLLKDGRKGMRLTRTLRDLDSHVEKRMWSGDEKDPKDMISDFSMNCEVFTMGTNGRCMLVIQYKDGGETGIEFVLGLNEQRMPVSILENRANLYRVN